MAATEALMDPAEIMADHDGAGVLDLSNQGLHKLDPKCLCGESHTLILDQNHIMKLELLEHNEALQQLSVASNRLVRMMSVSKLSHLRVLNLPHNSIGYIEGLKDLRLLQWLNLAGNNIKVIEQLQSCVSLQHLDLSDNNISHIGDLSKLSALKTLLLHGNIITTLRPVPAHLSPTLSVLSLAENEIRDLAEVSYLAPLHGLEQLSVMGNPCVMATPTLPACDYRPYVVSWCLRLKLLDGVMVSQKEGLKGEWLYSQGKGRAFRPGQHGQLVQYLASTCPLSATVALQSEEDAKLDRILHKQRQHQRQLQKTRLCCSQSPSHLEEQQWREEEEEEDEEEEDPQTDVDPGVQVNVWMGVASSPAAPVVRLPPAADDQLILEDVQMDEEKLHGSLLSSESAFLPFDPAVHPASAPDSGEEEFDDSLAPPTLAQPRPPEEESAECVLNGSVEGSEWSGAAVRRWEPHDAAVKIQAWWRGHCTRHLHPQAREVRAEIRLRRMQDHIAHLTAELERVRRQQEEDRLQRRVQEEAVKFLWKQLQVVLEWQSSVSSALSPSIPSAPLSSEISMPESGFHSAGARLERGGALETSRSPAGDSLVEQYLSSVQRLEEEEEEGERTETPPAPQADEHHLSTCSGHDP